VLLLRKLQMGGVGLWFGEGLGLVEPEPKSLEFVSDVGDVLFEEVAFASAVGVAGEGVVVFAFAE